MTISDIVLIIATLLAPLLAIQAQKWLERIREARQRRELIFKTLMATRVYNISQQHTEALNLIDIEFYKRKYKKVRESWKAYLDHLAGRTNDDDNKSWNEKRLNLFVDMMYEMGISLGYDFDKIHIKRASYYPQGLGEIDSDFI